jgi:hypothetical protein
VLNGTPVSPFVAGIERLELLDPEELEEEDGAGLDGFDGLRCAATAAGIITARTNAAEGRTIRILPPREYVQQGPTFYPGRMPEIAKMFVLSPQKRLARFAKDVIRKPRFLQRGEESR